MTYFNAFSQTRRIQADAVRSSISAALTIRAQRSRLIQIVVRMASFAILGLGIVVLRILAADGMR